MIGKSIMERYKAEDFELRLSVSAEADSSRHLIMCMSKNYNFPPFC